eukprot:CAMPEP_0177273060 /NCGR_PEP_ID=MMETSP0367-20130122/66411_1 /TAXON_ID=447022 ORGANISM="Scrippsiella hangoei-like, Strain SHHI-4" /NCGR_SAMPLE_ID=MMETSP0367 /ASSEMBLY_ACC=CAM_ASM_000362 /LENGTH=56 /DNA_ID=CAMNT_0018729261 /DNA_START=28 /DNA_END=195 /DNA_ORIENTATION=-
MQRSAELVSLGRQVHGQHHLPVPGGAQEAELGSLHLLRQRLLRLLVLERAGELLVG